MEMLYTMLLAPTDNYQIIAFLRIAIIVVMSVCSLFAILVVLFQQSNSSGIDAIGGSSETFFGKNKTKTFESKLKKFTVISLILICVLSFIFYLIQILPL
jgi:preprotein translocase subunit SecG